MNYAERLFKIIKSPHVSEKTSLVLEKYNAVVLKVAKYATKTDIKNALSVCFKVKAIKINILIIPKKLKRLRNKVGYTRSWKKAYVVLERGSKIDFSDKIQ